MNVVGVEGRRNVTFSDHVIVHYHVILITGLFVTADVIPPIVIICYFLLLLVV